MQIFATMRLSSYRHWEMDLPEILGTLWKLFVTVLLPNAKFWCVVSITFSVSLFGLYLRTKRNLRSAEYFLNVIRDVSKALARNHEVVAFGENGDVIYTTHPQLYENKEEFMQNLSGRVTASDNFQKFCKSFEENMPSSTTISGSGSGLHNQFKKWLATIGLLDKQNTLIGEQILVVTISDASRQFAEAEKIATSYDRLQNFLDYFPFGIFYINNTGEILGTNTTFANLVNMQKEKLIGININEFISNFDSIFDAINEENFDKEYFSSVLLEGKNYYYSDYLDRKRQSESLEGKSNIQGYRKVLRTAGSELYQNLDDEIEIQEKSANMHISFNPLLIGVSVAIIAVLVIMLILIN